MPVRRIGASLVVLGLLIAAPAPAAAEDGVHLQEGPADALGCHSLEVWNGGDLVVTIPADDGVGAPDQVVCAYNEKSAELPNGTLIFDWIRFGWDYFFFPYQPMPEVFGSDGTKGGTQSLHSLDFGLSCTGMWEMVGSAVFISETCPRYHDTKLTATRGTLASTFQLPGAYPGEAVNEYGNPALPLYTAIGSRIVYVADHPRKGRELYVSNGRLAGSMLLRDIRRGQGSSRISGLTSSGRTATFMANDGHGVAEWVTNGKKRGTHKL